MKPPGSSPDPVEAREPDGDEADRPGSASSSPLARPLHRRRLLAGLPFAIGAVILGKRPEAAYAGTDGDWTVIGNAPVAGRFLGTTNTQPLTIKTSNTTRMTVTAAGNVGVATTSPAAKLHAASPNAGAIAIYGSANAASGSGQGVKGNAVSPTGTGVSGVAPNSISTALNAIGVKGLATVGVQGTGEYMGVQGTSPNYAVFGFTSPDTQGIGVYGRGAQGVKGRSYTGLAVLGDTDSGTGVKGEAYAAGGAVKAMHGQCFGANGNGVVGEASNGTAAYGVWGISSSGYAGVFSGKALVTGNLSKGGGSFKIDHPLDPANKYLYHSFVESPDMMNVYNGNVTTDAKGEATVAAARLLRGAQPGLPLPADRHRPVRAGDRDREEDRRQPLHDQDRQAERRGLLAGDRHPPGRVRQRATASRSRRTSRRPNAGAISMPRNTASLRR